MIYVLEWQDQYVLTVVLTNYNVERLVDREGCNSGQLRSYG